MVPKTTSSSSSSKQGDLYQKMNDFVISRTPDQSQTARFLHQVVRVAMATISQEIGWNSAHLSTLDVLTDITIRYLLQVAKQTTKYTEHYGRTLVSEDDIALGFQDMHISLSELEEYVQQFDPLRIPKECPYFPEPRKTDLNFLRPGTSEVLTRPVHVHEYMPPMIFETEEKEENSEDGKEQQEETSSQLQLKSEEEDKETTAINPEEMEMNQGTAINGGVEPMDILVVEEPSQVPEVGSELIVAEPVAEVEVKTETTPEPVPVINNDLDESSDDDIEPASAKAAAVFATFKSTKKLESASENAALKRVRKMFEEQGHPVREITSVIMTTSGYLSESVEGRVADTRRPQFRDFFDATPPPQERRKKNPTMKRILEGVKKLDNHHAHSGDEGEGPGLFDVMDKIVPTSGAIIIPQNENLDASRVVAANGEILTDRPSKKLSKQERKLLAQSKKKELKMLKKQKLKKEKIALKKKSARSLEQAKEIVQQSSKDRKNKLKIFTKTLKVSNPSALTSKRLEKKKKKEKRMKIKELKLALTPLETNPDPLVKSTMRTSTELIESDEDFASADLHGNHLDVPSGHIATSPRDALTPEESPKKMRKLSGKLGRPPGEHQLFDMKQQKKAIKEKGLTISPTHLPPIPKLTKVKFAKRSLTAAGLSSPDDLPIKKKRGRPKKIWDTGSPGAASGQMALPAAQLANIGKSLMIKEPTLDHPMKIMKIRKGHMEPVLNVGNEPFIAKPPTMSPKPHVVTADLLKRLPAQPGLIPDTSTVPPMRLPKELPASISITPAAISPQKESPVSSRSFSGGLPPNVCSSVTITRIDMSHQQKLPSAYDDSITPGIGPIQMGEKRSAKHKGVPPPPPLQMPIQADNESGITITPIMMGKPDRFDLPPPPPLQERPPPRPEKSSMLAKLDEELSSKEQRKKEKERRKEMKKGKKKKTKDKDRTEKKDKDKSEKKKKKNKEKSEKEELAEPPVATVPKLTLKLSGHSNTTTPVDSPNPPQVFSGSEQEPTVPTKKITFKPMEEKKRTPSPDFGLARFSPLVTRPQKPVRAAKSHAAAAVAADAMGASLNRQEIISFPSMGRESSGGSERGGGSRRGRGRPPKGGAPIPEPVAPVKTPAAKASKQQSSVTVLETETVGKIMDEQGNTIWICPACGRQDDGSPMIGCDICDDWYHFTCVGIMEAPEEEDSWFCHRCLKKQKPEGKKKKK